MHFRGHPSRRLCVPLCVPVCVCVRRKLSTTSTQNGRLPHSRRCPARTCHEWCCFNCWFNAPLQLLGGQGSGQQLRRSCLGARAVGLLCWQDKQHASSWQCDKRWRRRQRHATWAPSPSHRPDTSYPNRTQPQSNPDHGTCLGLWWRGEPGEGKGAETGRQTSSQATYINSLPAAQGTSEHLLVCHCWLRSMWAETWHSGAV